MSEIAQQLKEVLDLIEKQALSCGIKPPKLIAVSKTFPSEAIQHAYDAGQRIFGESRWQEAVEKIPSLPSDIEWHFIGALQRNKVRKILPLFPFIHAVDSLRLAKYIDQIAAELELKPKLFLQVNLAHEVSKGGYEAQLLRDEISQLKELKHVTWCGLMIIPPPEEDDEKTRDWFRGLRELRDTLQTEQGLSLPLLSMGMSSDFPLAITEGATHVRVGSAIFGKRAYRVEGELG